MSKTGTLLQVTSDQDGATPRLVTETEPLPVGLIQDGEDVSDGNELNVISSQGERVQTDELTLAVVKLEKQQKLTNLYLSLILGEELSIEDI